MFDLFSVVLFWVLFWLWLKLSSDWRYDWLSVYVLMLLLTISPTPLAKEDWNGLESISIFCWDNWEATCDISCDIPHLCWESKESILFLFNKFTITLEVERTIHVIIAAVSNKLFSNIGIGSAPWEERNVQSKQIFVMDERLLLESTKYLLWITIPMYR